MAGFTDYTEGKVLDHIFGATSYSAPGTLYAALSTTTPTDAGGNFTEPSGNSYARVSITNNTTNFPNASGGSKSNGTTITFPTASGSWGTVTHIGLYDASSNGNLIVWAALSASKTIGNGDTASVAASGFTVTLD